MKLEIGNFNHFYFHEETGYAASEHPHLYLSWLQVKLTDKMSKDLEVLGERMSEMERKLAGTPQ